MNSGVRIEKGKKNLVFSLCIERINPPPGVNFRKYLPLAFYLVHSVALSSLQIDLRSGLNAISFSAHSSNLLLLDPEQFKTFVEILLNCFYAFTRPALVYHCFYVCYR